MKNTIQSYCNILLSLRWLAKCILAQSQSSCENFERCCLSWIPFFILRRDVCTSIEGLWPSSFMSSHEQSSIWAYTHTILCTTATPMTSRHERWIENYYDGTWTAHEDAKFIDLAELSLEETSFSPLYSFSVIRAGELNAIYIVIIYLFNLHRERNSQRIVRREYEEKILESIHTNVLSLLLSSNYISFRSSPARQTFHQKKKKICSFLQTWNGAALRSGNFKKFIIPLRRAGECCYNAEESTRWEWRNFRNFLLLEHRESSSREFFFLCSAGVQEKRWEILTKYHHIRHHVVWSEQKLHKTHFHRCGGNGEGGKTWETCTA